MSSRSCVLDRTAATVFPRTCKLHSKSAQQRKDMLDRSRLNIITAESVPRCQVAQISQITASMRPIAFGVRRCNWNGTVCACGYSITSTPSDRLRFITAIKSLSCQSVISSGTNRSDSRSCFLTTGSINKAKVSRVSACILSLV